MAATAHLSEAWLELVLATLLRQCPFCLRGFHSDSGSEFINQTVARLLNKLLIEQTKSRPQHSNDKGSPHFRAVDPAAPHAGSASSPPAGLAKA